MYVFHAGSGGEPGSGRADPRHILAIQGGDQVARGVWRRDIPELPPEEPAVECCRGTGSGWFRSIQHGTPGGKPSRWGTGCASEVGIDRPSWWPSLVR